MSWRCPVCDQPLVEEPDAFACATGHRFDRAREGYVNLLRAGRLKGRPAGDDEAMVRARRTVFDAGLYLPVIDAVATAAGAACRAVGQPPSIIDCGCGEGAYLAAAADTSGADAWGIDISKPAVRMASRRHTAHHYAVASSYALPCADASYSAAISVFSPRPFAEMMRVVVPGGSAIVVTPGPQHLAELKSLIYDDPQQHPEPDLTAERDTWPSMPDSIDVVQFEVVLHDPALRLALLQMTPFWWSADPTRRDRVQANAQRVTVDMRLATFTRPA